MHQNYGMSNKSYLLTCFFVHSFDENLGQVCVCVYTWSRKKFLNVIPFHLSFRCTVFQDLITMINAWKYWNERQGSERVYPLAAIRRALTIHMSMIYSLKGHIIFILYWILDIRGSQILGDLVCQHLIFLLKLSFFPTLYTRMCISSIAPGNRFIGHCRVGGH